MKLRSMLFIALSLLIGACSPSTPGEKLNDASSLFNQGETDEALKIVNKILIDDSLNISAHKLRGQILWNRRDTLRSKEEFDLILRIPRTPERQEEELEKLIDWEITHANKSAAREFLQRDLELYRDNPTKHLKVAQYAVGKYLEMADSSEAIKVMDQLINEFPDRYDVAKYVFQQHLRLDDTITARKSIALVIKTKKGPSRLFKLIAELDFQQNDLPSSAHNWKRYLKEHKDDADGWFSLGVCQSKLRRKKSAKDAFKQAMKLGHQEGCQNYREMSAKTRYSVYSRCCDGTRSSSTGRGTCSHHGGVCRTEYDPYKEYEVNCR